MNQSALTLDEHPTLPDLQRYVADMVKERGFDQEAIAEKFVLFLEECGEFAKAVRKASGIKVDQNSVVHTVGGEAADVIFVLLDICNGLGIDLEQAFRAKEKQNEQREWK